MSDLHTDPIRLLEDPASGPQLRSDLSVATRAELMGLDVSTGISSLETAVSAQAGLSAGTKFAMAGLLVAGGAALWFALSRPDPAPSSPEVVTRVVAATSAGSSVRQDKRPAQQVQTSPAVRSVVHAPAGRTAPEALQPPVLPESETEKLDEAPDLPTSARRPVKAKRAPPSIQEATAEAELILRARKALVSSPAEALALTEEANRTYRRGMLVQEREAIAIKALVQLGRTTQAVRRGERFLERYGRGPHAKAVRTALQELQSQ